MVAADVTGCAKTPKWRFGRTKKGFSDPSPPKKTRHIETVEVVFPGSPAGEEFSHSLSRRRLRVLQAPLDFGLWHFGLLAQYEMNPGDVGHWRWPKNGSAMRIGGCGGDYC